MANIPFVDDQDAILLRTNADGPLHHATVQSTPASEACNYRSFEFKIQLDKNGDTVDKLEINIQHLTASLGNMDLSDTVYVLTGFLGCSVADFSFVGNVLTADTGAWGGTVKFSFEVPALGSSMLAKVRAPLPNPAGSNQTCSISLIRRAKG